MRATALAFLFILAFICGPAAAQTADLRALIETGKYAEAETTAKKLLAKTPNDHIVRHQLAEVLAITGRYTEAIAEFERAAKDNANKERLESELRRAELLELTGQEDQAQSIYQSFVKYYNANDPETAFELTMIARALVHLERYQDANDMFRAAIEADSNFLEAQLSAGELFTQKYAYADAATFLSDALKIDPNSARAYLDIARNKRYEGSEEMNAALNRALTLNPNYVEALALKAALALEAGQYDAASVELDKALKINARSPEIHSLRAALLYLRSEEHTSELQSQSNLVCRLLLEKKKKKHKQNTK